MESEVKKEISEVLQKTINSIKKNDVKTLRDSSNALINSSSIFQEESFITAAVITYSLSKIFERTDYTKYSGWNKFYETTEKSLKGALFALENNNEINYQRNLKQILEVIAQLDSKLKKYIQQVIEQAQVARGSRLHEHGLSLGRTAELLNIDKWELMEYIGKTGISESEESLTLDIEKRLRIARSLFR
ncbi:hypothetical protein K8R47_02330 [archaeon]|nr:hypothetical protein [archaeon]